MYFICDIYDSSEYGKIKSFKELKDLLISEVIDDLKNNRDDYDIVVDCTDILKCLANGNYSEKYIIDNLQGFGWEIINLTQLKNNLYSLKEYFKGTNNTSSFDNVINMIERKKGE